MKRPVVATLALLLCSLIFALTASAVDAPHFDLAAGNSCSTCHTVHQTLGSTGYNNICQTCHRPGDPAAGSKPLTPADAANPLGIHPTGSNQTSHRWDGSTTNPAAGAQPPAQALMTADGLLTRTDGQLACVSCHNQHDKGIDGKFLRMANDQDQLCLDCHRSRNTTNSTTGTHPVGVIYDGTKAGFKAIPANSANPTADLNNYLKSGKVSCSTCHGVHFTDSRGDTVDGSANFANLTNGDGNLLRTERRGAKVASGAEDRANICTNCHADKKNHNLNGQDVQCNDCHGAHVEFDPNDPFGTLGTNVSLIRRAVPKGSSGSGKVVFTAAANSYMNSSGTGVCQGCHAVPTPGGNYPQDHSGSDPASCTTCHTHSSSKGSFSGVACTACHGYPPSTNTTGGTTGAATGYSRKNESTTPHAFHAASPFTFACSECHKGNSHNAGTFSDVFIDKTGIRAGASATYTPGTFTCSSVYCHSAGQGAGGAALGVGDYASPTWSTTTLSCGSCHKNMKSDPAASGSHAAHAQTSAISCATCHNGYTETSVNRATHIDGSINLSFSGEAATASYSQGATHAPGSGFGTCSNVSCHADPYSAGLVTTPVWGTTGSGCAACHTGTNVITANGPATGSHKNTAGHAVACTTCHAAGTSATTPPGTGHADGNIDVANVGYPLDKAKGSAAASCSSASCHADPYSAGLVTTPVWGTTGSGCAACHSGANVITATGPATGSHTTTAGHAVACITCHAAGTSATTAPGTGHANGSIDVANVGYQLDKVKGSAAASCSSASCHADPYSAGLVTSPVWGTTGGGCAACHSGANVITAKGPATGSHTTTAGHAVACTTCHAAGTSATTAPGTGHANGSIDVANVGYPLNKAKGSAAATCSTASCHANVYGAGFIITPVWGSTGSGCSACHKTPIGTTGPATGSHALHNDTTCTDCHAAGTTQTTKPTTGHIDGTITVTNGYPVTAKHAAGSYAATAKCTSASCHANVYGAGSVTTPAWGTTGSGCNACHTTPIGPTGPATGSHTNVASHAVACTTCHASGTSANSVPGSGHADGNIDVANVGYPLDKAKGSAGASCTNASCHLNVYGAGTVTTPVWGSTGNDCAACHTTPIGSTGPATGSHTNTAGHTVACTTCHAAGTSANSAPSTGHANGTIDVANVGYPLNKAKGTAGATCTTASCHEDPYSAGQVTTPVWGSSAGCAACHTGTKVITPTGPATGSHAVHNDPTCTHCHAAGTTQTTKPSSGHLDGTITVTNSYPVTAKHAAGSYAANAKCSSTYCHGTLSPAWGAVGSLTCASCHGASSALPGAHAIHISTPAIASSYTNMSGNVSTPTGYRFSCAACHKGQHANGPANATGVAQVFFGFTSATMKGNYTYSGTQGAPVDKTTFTWSTGGTGCNTTYCHSDGNGTNGAASVAWNTTASSVPSCAKCHGDATTLSTGSHTKHVVTNALGCVKCHAKTVSDNTTISDKSKHINKFKDYSSTLGGGSTTYTSGKTCTAAACHSNPYGVGSVTTPAWGTSTGCAACHTTPIGATGPATGSHTAHNDSTCIHCHATGTTATTAPSLVNGHADGNIDVIGVGYPANVVKHAAGAYTGTCNNASCHADPYSVGLVTTTVWGTSTGCAACHTIAIDTNGPDTGSHTTVDAHKVACTNCHAAGTSATAAPTLANGHADGNIDIVGVGYPANVTKHAAGTGYSACATASCHASPVAATLIVTPVWGSTGNGCAACHTGGAANANVITATGPATGSHGISGGGHSVACITCHAVGTTANSAPLTGHADGNIDVANVGYPLSKAKGSAGASCSAASCHENVYGTSFTATPAWGSTGNGCSACHTIPITAKGPATGSHTNTAGHAVACTTCHATGTTETTAPTLANGHADGNIDVIGVGYPVDKVKGSAAATCSAASCHASPVAATLIVTPVWGSTGNGCAACHNGVNVITATGPATGSHTNTPGHAVACTTCHAADTTATTAPSFANGHADGDIDVANVDYATLNKTKGTAGTTCSAASCHASPVAAASIVTPAWGTTGNGCAACHKGGAGNANVITATGPSTGSHAKHTAACISCHAVGTTATTAPTLANGHADGNIDVIGVGYPADKVKGSAYTTCSTASCHADPYGTGVLVTPVWGASTGCAACHKNSVAFGVYSAPATGAHTKHLALAGALCNQCHAGAVANVSGGIDHNDGVVDVTNGYPAVTRHAAGTYSGTCTSAACHANPYGAGSVTTPTWGATGCVACHSAGFTATGPATGSHALHITACTSCHATGTSETTAPTLANGHNDGNIDIVGVGYPPNATKHAAGTGYSSCATATCHGSISPVWGANTANDTCTKCHGTPTSTGVISNAANNRYLIAPFGTLSSNVSNNPKIGAHQTHLKFSNGFSNYSTVTFRCENCHGTLPVSGSHANGTSAPAFQGLAIQGGMTSAIRRPAFNTANLTCSNTYCHNPAASNVLKMAANTGSALFPSWTSAKYIDTTSGTKTNANCNKCHKVPGDSTFSGFTAAFRHTGLTIANDCSICHGHNGDAAGTIGNRHIDGILRGLDCNGCHGLPPSTKAGKAAGYGITFNEASTAHVSHAGGGATNYQFTCDQCHKGNDHMTGTFTDVFKSPATTLAGSSATYTSPTCTNVYCHSSGNGTYKGAVTTIAWGNNKDSIIGLADQAVRCATCHDTTTYSASHDKHINITTGKGYGCVTCHAATVSNNTTLLAAAKLTNGTHVNAVKDVQFSGVSPAVGTNCATVYCHSNGKGAAPVITPVWGIATGACGACHLTAASTPALATGSHTTHFTVIASTDPTVVCVNCHTYTSETAAPHVDGTLNVTTTGCDTCHADPYGAAVTAPAWGTSASGCASCHKGANAITATGPATGSHAKHTAACISCHAVGTTATTAPTLANGHTDGNIDVIGVGYTLNKVKGSAYTTCSNASCHADPYGTSILVTPVWGTVSGCAACHKNSVAFGVYSAPATGAHTKHLALAGAACNQCHAGAVANFNGGTSHANGTVNVSGTKATYPDTAKHAAGTYSNNCTTACHGQGKPVWGASYTDGSAFPYSAAQCGKCHSESGTVTVGTPFYSTAIPKVTLNTNAKVGAHTAHLTASDSLHPALNCSDCHGTVNLNDATHLNGVTNFNWSTLAKTGGLTPSYNATTGVCSNVYCHGGAMPGGDTSGTNRTPAWNNANYLPATLSVAGCSTCHGFPPPPSVGHPPVTIPAGFPATAKLGTTCSCHGNIDQQTSAPNTYANIFVDKNLHINGILEGGACNDCHGYPPVRSGFAGAGVQNNWSSAKLQNYSGGGGAHTIDNHVSKTANKNDGFANCVNCHSPADHLTNPTEFKPSQNIKVQINQRFRMEESKQARYSSNRLDGNAHVPGNCSNISCHFGASPAWNER